MDRLAGEPGGAQPGVGSQTTGRSPKILSQAGPVGFERHYRSLAGTLDGVAQFLRLNDPDRPGPLPESGREPSAWDSRTEKTGGPGVSCSPVAADRSGFALPCAHGPSRCAHIE